MVSYTPLLHENDHEVAVSLSSGNGDDNSTGWWVVLRLPTPTLKSSHPRPPRWCRPTPSSITVSTNVQPASDPSYGEGFQRPRHDGDAQLLSCSGYSTTSVPPLTAEDSCLCLLLRWSRQAQLVHPQAPAVRQLRWDRPPQTWPGKSHAALEDR